MFKIRLAEVVIGIDNKYAYVEELCRAYQTDDDYTLKIAVTEEEIVKEQQQADEDYPKAYCESICIYRKLCSALLPYDIFLLHAAVIEKDGAAYAFTAKSGTGKTTHIAQWQACYEDVAIINGDKPLLRVREDGEVWAYGTPWCGKENLETNRGVPLKGLCFLERGCVNQIAPLDEGAVIERLFNQVILPTEPQAVDKFLRLIDMLLQKVPCYVMQCTISQEAAMVAYTGMCHV